MPRTLTAAGLVIGGLFLLGCGGSVPSADVEEEIATQLSDAVDGVVEPEVTCPDDLESEVGATMECEVSVEGDDAVYAVSIEVTAVDGDRVSYDIQVADEPLEG